MICFFGFQNLCDARLRRRRRSSSTAWRPGATIESTAPPSRRASWRRTCNESGALGKSFWKLKNCKDRKSKRHRIRSTRTILGAVVCWTRPNRWPRSRGRGGVICQLAGHEAQDLRLVPAIRPRCCYWNKLHQRRPQTAINQSRCCVNFEQNSKLETTTLCTGRRQQFRT